MRTVRLFQNLNDKMFFSHLPVTNTTNVRPHFAIRVTKCSLIHLSSLCCFCLFALAASKVPKQYNFPLSKRTDKTPIENTSKLEY